MREISDDPILYLDRSLDYTLVCICQNSANVSLKIQTFLLYVNFTLKEKENLRKLLNSS